SCQDVVTDARPSSRASTASYEIRIGPLAIESRIVARPSTVRAVLVFLARSTTISTSGTVEGSPSNHSTSTPWSRQIAAISSFAIVCSVVDVIVGSNVARMDTVCRSHASPPAIPATHRQTVVRTLHTPRIARSLYKGGSERELFRHACAARRP